MPKHCHFHPEKEAYKTCDRCYKPICHDCSNIYWKTNTIAAMFNPQKEKNDKYNYCLKCLRIEKIKNVFITLLFLVLILGIITTGILIGTQ